MHRMRMAIVSAGLLGASLVFSGAPLAQESAAAAPAAETAAPAPASPPATSAQPAPPRTAAPQSKTAAHAAAEAKAGKARDTIELDTTDITGNRELPKVMYIVPWKHSDLGDLTGKPLNSLVDQVLQPVDRDVFKRENRYYGAVAGASGAADSAGPAAAPQGGAHGSGAGQASGARDER